MRNIALGLTISLCALSLGATSDWARYGEAVIPESPPYRYQRIGTQDLMASNESSPTSAGLTVEVTWPAGLAVRSTPTTTTQIGVVKPPVRGLILEGPVLFGGYNKCLMDWRTTPTMRGWSALWAKGWTGAKVVATPTPKPEPTATPIPCPTPIPSGVPLIGAVIDLHWSGMTTESLTQQGYAPMADQPWRWAHAWLDEPTSGPGIRIIIRDMPYVNLEIENQ